MALRRSGRAEYSAGNFERAETLLRNALDVAQRSKDDYMVATAEDDLGDVYVSEERLIEAERSYSRSLAIFRRLPDRTFETAVVLRNLGSVYSIDRRNSEALKVLSEALKLIEKQTTARAQTLAAQILTSLGVIYSVQGKLKRAETVLAQSVRISSSALADFDPGDVPRSQPDDRRQVLASGLNVLGAVHQGQRKYEKAEEFYKRSLEVTEERLGPTHPDLTLTLINLGALYTEVGRYREAEAQYQRSLAILERTGPALDSRRVRTLHGLGKTYFKEGEKTSAEATLVQAVDLARRNPVASGEIPTLLDTYAAVLNGLGKLEEAQRSRAEAKRTRAAMALRVRVPN